MRSPLPWTCVLLAFVTAPRAALAQLGPGSGSAAAPTKGADRSVAFRFGTLGLGLELNKLVNGHVGARIGASLFTVSSSASPADITYQAKAKFHSVTALFDLYPGDRGSFHLTGGIATNPVTVTGTAQPTAAGDFTINGHSYTTTEVGTLSLEAKFPSVSPYLGLGFGTPANRHAGLKFIFDLGAVIGKPDLTLTSTGAASNSQLASDLAAQRDKTLADARKYFKVYPNFAFGIAYRF